MVLYGDFKCLARQDGPTAALGRRHPPRLPRVQTPSPPSLIVAVDPPFRDFGRGRKRGWLLPFTPSLDQLNQHRESRTRGSESSPKPACLEPVDSKTGAGAGGAGAGAGAESASSLGVHVSVIG